MDDANQIQVIDKEENTPAPVQSEAGSIMAVIQQAALNPDVDIDKMERLYAMHEKALDRIAEREFNTAFAEAQKKIQPVVKNKYNDQTRSGYSDLSAVNDAIMPIVNEHGFSVSFGTDDCPKENHFRVTAEVSHTGGFTKRYHADVANDLTGIKGTQNKTSTHAFGSTMSYGRRYLMLLIFNIATKDDDGNAAGKREPPPLTDDQKKAREQLIKKGKALARSGGMAALADWWGNLSGSDKTLVGKEAKDEIKKEAMQYDPR